MLRHPSSGTLKILMPWLKHSVRQSPDNDSDNNRGQLTGNHSMVARTFRLLVGPQTFPVGSELKNGITRSCTNERLNLKMVMPTIQIKGGEKNTGNTR